MALTLPEMNLNRMASAVILSGEKTTARRGTLPGLTPHTPENAMHSIAQEYYPEDEGATKKTPERHTEASRELFLASFFAPRRESAFVEITAKEAEWLLSTSPGNRNYVESNGQRIWPAHLARHVL